MNERNKEVRILHIEDDSDFRVLVGFALLDCQVEYDLDSVSNFESALEIIEETGDNELEPYDVILLDGNIRPDSYAESDARQILESIKDNGLASYVIGLSSNPLESVDEDLGKQNASQLSQVIENYAANHNQLTDRSAS